MLKQDWFAVPEGEIHPKMFTAGTVLSGELLERAKALGLIEPLQEDEPEPKQPKRARK
ncbi:hypothetical protein [Gemmobacter denitrificans]|uniref:Uncharacterized protein n=1 Tax=Gemmobacter denitrificans TaxID=3123040 RepID=A0ABU8BQX7_9RHOB